MTFFYFEGGHKFLIKDGPDNLINYSHASSIVALVPPRILNFKCKILVKKGDNVILGQTLFYNKKNTNIKFVSPASGSVKDIVYGHKRSLKSIEIEKHTDDKYALQHESFTKKNVEDLVPDEIIEYLINSGIWNKFKTLPSFDFIENSKSLNDKTTSLFVSLFSTQPHMANIQLLLQNKDYMKLFLYGLRIASKIFKKIYVFNNQTNFPAKINEFSKDLNNIYLHSIEDKYPAENPGLQQFIINDTSENTLNISTVAFTFIEIGYLFTQEKIIQDTYISISGNGVNKKGNFIVKIGSPIKVLIKDLKNQDQNTHRYISGGYLTGKKINMLDYLATDDMALQITEEDNSRTFLVFFRLGFDHLTLLKTWISGFLSPKHYPLSTSNNGEERACIQCGYCFDICPVKIMPSLLMKAAIIHNIEKMEYMDIQDCIECELCTFICPSKIEIGEHIKYGKEFIKKEG